MKLKAKKVEKEKFKMQNISDLAESWGWAGLEHRGDARFWFCSSSWGGQWFTGVHIRLYFTLYCVIPYTQGHSQTNAEIMS